MAFGIANRQLRIAKERFPIGAFDALLAAMGVSSRGTPP